MSVIRDLINSVDNTPAVIAEVKENLHTLMSLAEARAQKFEDDIIIDLKTGKTTDDLTVPVTKVVRKMVQYRAQTKNSTTKVLDAVAKEINGMIDDHSAKGIVTGISNIVTNALDTIMGTGEGTEQVVKFYSVVADYPAIVRFDFAFWARKISAKSIKEHCETALACVAYKSAVDVKKLEFNDFLTLYGPILNAGYGSDQAKMEEMIDKAQKIYIKFITPLKSNADSAELLSVGDLLPEINMAAAVQTVMQNKVPKGIVLTPPTPVSEGDF